MPADLRDMLNESEQALLRETEAARIELLDEDDLAALHDRVRRARNKYSKLYRRRASAQVVSDRSRARAHVAHGRAARKAELFEDALARVSRRLAKLAKEAAAELRAERLAAAKRDVGSAGRGRSRVERPAGVSRARQEPGSGSRRTPASEKARASTKAEAKRRQAKRDRRGGA